MVNEVNCPHQDTNVGAVTGHDLQEVTEGLEGDAVRGREGATGHQHHPLLWGKKGFLGEKQGFWEKKMSFLGKNRVFGRKKGFFGEKKGSFGEERGFGRKGGR